MELRTLDFAKCYIFKHEFPSRCNGVFRFDRTCTHCDCFTECLLRRVAEFGCAGRPRTLLKDVLFTVFYFHGIAPPDFASDLFRKIKPFATQNSATLRSVVKSQVEQVYKFKLLNDFFYWWWARKLQIGKKWKWFSKVKFPGMFFEWLTGAQVFRIGITMRAIILKIMPYTDFNIISVESTGFCAFQFQRLVPPSYVRVYWQQLPEGKEVLDAMSDFLPVWTKYHKLPFDGFPKITKSTILVLQVESLSRCVDWLCWIRMFRRKVRFVFVAFKDFEVFKLCQLVMFPIGFCKFENVHYPYLALFDVFPVCDKLSCTEGWG